MSHQAVPAVSTQPKRILFKTFQRKTCHIYRLVGKKTENYAEHVLIAEPYYTEKLSGIRMKAKEKASLDWQTAGLYVK